MNILVDENIPLAQAFFGTLGQVRTAPGRSISPAQLVDVDALIVRSVTTVGQALLQNSAVRFVGTCTIGTDHLDVPYLQDQGIEWSAAPGCNANSVVEYVIVALATCRPDWQTRQIGIVGCGNVGGLLYRRLRALGVNLKVYDPLLDPKKLPNSTTLDDVLQSDIVCLHTPLTHQGSYPTVKMIGAHQLNAMHSDALLLNAGRGDVIDGPALLQHLQTHPEFSVVLDVWPGEPNIDLALMDIAQIATPHIAGYSYDGKVAGTQRIYQALCRFLGAAPRLTTGDLLPSDRPDKLHWDLSSGPDLNDLLQQAYDITADDRAMRWALQQASEKGDSLAAAFDLLRKTYPVRREWPYFTVSAAMTEAQLQLLTTLGFNAVN